MTFGRITIGVAAVWLWALPAAGQWVVLNEDPSRLVAPAELGSADPDEKDYAWGDVDGDGDIDLVVVRKQPFTTQGKRANLLLINEEGVLTDRTAEFASDSDIAGDQGFLTPTNDRDVTLADVNGDLWLDIITAVTLTDNQAKHLSHPRIYINKGMVDGAWQGFRYEDARIPQMHATAGPRFCAVSAGDVTGDDAPDLFFSDYDAGLPPQIFDYNDRLLVNDGFGVFSDQTAARMSPEMYTSVFGISNMIVDMNEDGVNDIVRLTSNGVPYHVAIIYNDPDNEGYFDRYDSIYSLSPYHSAVGDLNGNGKMDVVAIDDGNDRYLLNQGLDAQGMVDFSPHLFPSQTAVINAGNVAIADLDRDGFNDVIIADVDVDIPGCAHQTFIFHNQANPPTVSFQEEDQVIPAPDLSGVYDVAVFDIDGNGWLDLVLGRCSGTRIWMNSPPIGLTFAYPQGLPAMLTPEQTNEFQVQLEPLGEAIEPGTPAIHVSVDGGPFESAPLVPLGDGLYLAAIQGGQCTDTLEFYLSAQLTGGSSYADPPAAAAGGYQAFSAAGTQLVFADDVEADVSAWAIQNDPSLTAGAWEQAQPNVTVFNGRLAAPAQDASPGGSMAFVTTNGPIGGAAGDSDVDGGPTRLVSPVIDLQGAEAFIGYWRWVFSEVGVPDTLSVEISNDDGANWTPVESVADTGSVWTAASFFVSDYVTPTAQMRIRFGMCDCPNDSVAEAGIDDVTVNVITCTAACPWDLDASGDVGVTDLLNLLGQWGTDPGGPPDFDDSGDVGVTDLLALLGAWGGC